MTEEEIKTFILAWSLGAPCEVKTATKFTPFNRWVDMDDIWDIPCIRKYARNGEVQFRIKPRKPTND